MGGFLHNVFFSDEPGYYEDGNFGIRLETILRTVSMNVTDQDASYGKN
jgi:Xaa-Pro aminopeptidase